MTDKDRFLAGLGKVSGAMTDKATIKALERVFAAEINGRLPYQSKAHIFEKLCAEGLVQKMDRRFGGNDRFAVTVTGWELTHAGRILYCLEC